MMIDLERQKENFKNHVAKFTDYGNIKIVDFKNPDSSNYRIRFLFEEDYCRCHISGDLGELSATNYNNMTFGGFEDFVDNTGYFEEKIDCHKRAIYYFDEDNARKQIMDSIDEYDLAEAIRQEYYWKREEEAIKDFVDDILGDFDDRTGIGKDGYEILEKYYSDAWEIVGDLGKEETGILDLYMLAYKLAMEQINADMGKDYER